MGEVKIGEPTRPGPCVSVWLSGPGLLVDEGGLDNPSPDIGAVREAADMDRP